MTCLRFRALHHRLWYELRGRLFLWFHFRGARFWGSQANTTQETVIQGRRLRCRHTRSCLRLHSHLGRRLTNRRLLSFFLRGCHVEREAITNVVYAPEIRVSRWRLPIRLATSWLKLANIDSTGSSWQPWLVRCVTCRCNEFRRHLIW